MMVWKGNPNFRHQFNYSGANIWSWRILIITSFFVLLSLESVLADSGRNQSLEWQVLTKKNFSSQIRLQPHILLFVTVPWSGESRSLMKDIAHVAANKLEDFGSLQLMVIYRNKEKMLADVLGATEKLTVFCYHHSLSYKYQGRLRAQNILSSVSHILSLRPEEIPLKLLNTHEDLKTFSQSTDKTVLVLEFCGWTRELLNKGNSNGSENVFGRDASDSAVDVFSEANFSGQTNQSLKPKRMKNDKDMRYEVITCPIEKGLTGNPWLEGLIFTNDTAPSTIENEGPAAGLSCSLEDFQRYELFFSHFRTLAREYFLPAERQRFGLISERSLLSSLGIKDPDSWLVMVNFAECANCTKILKEGEDLKSVLGMHQSLVTELEGEGHDTNPALPANKPSVILFVDRSSESDTRRKSKEALDTFRKLASQKGATRKESSAQGIHAKKGQSTSKPSDHSVTELSALTQLDKLNSKISVTIIKDGKPVPLDDIPGGGQGKSIHEILNYLLQQKKEAKLSLVAKEVGFQLLSDDLDVDIANMLPKQTEISESKKLSEPLTGAIAESSLDIDGLDIDGLDIDGDNLGSSATQTPKLSQEQPKLADTETEPSRFMEENTLVEHTWSIPVMPKQKIVGEDVQIRSLVINNVEGQQISHPDFKGLFFFSDGDYRLLRALTGGSNIPSVVILDPVSQQHYLFPEETSLSYASLVDFLDGFLNRTLQPYQQSELVLATPKEATKPPFINLDFHEVESVPQVTANKFSELVLGINQSDIENAGLARKRDVLVLFSNTWCGFCQRMELVVREVFRAFKNYIKMSKSNSRNEGSTLTDENLEYAATNELPLIFLMDCTLNDCSSLLKSTGQRELYPALMLFPAQRKSAISYQGDMSVTAIIKFVADHGTNSHHLNRHKGFIWTDGQNGIPNQVPTKDKPPTSIHEEDPNIETHEILLNDRTATTRTSKLKSIDPHLLNKLHTGSILISTDKLLNAPPFDKSMILIVQADQTAGFHGLIINKHINWESLEGLDTGYDFVKQAPLSYGGPVMTQEMPLVSLTKKVNEEGYEIFPSVYLLDQLTTIREIEGLKAGNLSATDYWFFLGYSSWGWHQLFSEIAEGAWDISDDPKGQFEWPETSPSLTVDEK